MYYAASNRQHSLRGAEYDAQLSCETQASPVHCESVRACMHVAMCGGAEVAVVSIVYACLPCATVLVVEIPGFSRSRGVACAMQSRVW